MSAARALAVGLAAASLVLAASSCKPERTYESVCQIVRRDVVEQDEDGTPSVVDLELEWDACPGDQFQVIRGDKAFAACSKKYAIGDLVPVVVRHWWDERGHYRWGIQRVGACKRSIDRGGRGSYEKSRECTDYMSSGRRAGFRCSRKPFKALVARCPWTARD